MYIFAPARADCVEENIYDVWAKNYVHDDHNRGGCGVFPPTTTGVSGSACAAHAALKKACLAKSLDAWSCRFEDDRCVAWNRGYVFERTAKPPPSRP